ncbi:YrhM, partial [Listeria ivanovii FSL F6-596]
FFTFKRSILTTLAIVIAVFIITISTNSAIAQAMMQVPLVKNIVQVFVGTEHTEKTAKTEISLKLPKIQGLEEKTLQKDINKAYINTGEELLKEYKTEIERGNEYIEISSDFEEINNTNQLLTIRLTTEKIRASSYTENSYLNLDKKNQKILKLNDLFKDDSYVNLIKNNILLQTHQQMETNPEKIYWDINEWEPSFSAQNLEKHFYINTNNKLVITFNKYEVAPGSMGNIEFKIPTSVIKNCLKNNTFIK